MECGLMRSLRLPQIIVECKREIVAGRLYLDLKYNAVLIFDKQDSLKSVLKVD